MIHTLLPVSARKALLREYRMRAAVVFLSLLSVSGLIGVVALFPTFLRVQQERALQENISTNSKKNDDPTIQKIQQSLSLSSSLLSALSDKLDQPKLSVLVSDIIGARGNVSLATLGITRVGTTTAASVNIGGVAPDRESLLAFKSRLELMAPDNRVELPVSQLATSRNIPFSIQLTAHLK